MPFSIFLELTISACITVWSPGPNNILLLSTASRYGLKKNCALLLGIWSGSLTLMCLSGIFCNTLGHLMPSIQPVMRYIGAAYILYLAWKTFHRLPPKEQDVKSRPSYLSGLLLQLLNIKIIIYGLTMFSSFILPYETRISFLFLYAVYLMLLGAVGNLIWALAGNVLRGFYDSHYRLMNLMMSVLLVWCALRIVLSAFPVS